MARASKGYARRAVIVAVVAVMLALGFVAMQGALSQQPTGQTPSPSVTVNTDAQLGQLFSSQTSDVQVQGVGWVTRLLADDNEGSRHQRFILQLASGQTLLVAHNIDLAPKLQGLQVGDRVGFYGEYVYTAQGGTIHWTHHDPAGKHVAGWLEWQGQRYQ